MSSIVLLSVVFLFQVVPSFIAMSFCHRLFGHPFDLFPLLGCNCVQRLVHLLSLILAIRPAHLHFCLSVYSMMSVIFVLFLVSEHSVYLVALDPTSTSPLLFGRFSVCLSIVKG